MEKNRIEKIKSSLISEDTIIKLSLTFKVLGEPSRTKILLILADQELCVCDIATILNMSQSAVSQQLRILRNLDLVGYRKQGKQICYSLKDEHINNLCMEGLRHVEEK